MELLLNRFRNLSVLLAAILAQLVLLAYQVKSNQDVRLVRLWAVAAVTPLARVIETGRSGVSHFLNDYFVLLDVQDENKKMKSELGRITMENQYLRNQLSTADRAGALAIFQKQSPSRTVGAHVIGNTTGAIQKGVIVDRGSGSGIENGMAVITPDGIVGKVVSVFPGASFVLLITDPTFAAGVTSQVNHVQGTLKGQGNSTVIVDYVQNEEKVDSGEWFYTSGDDRIFPKGLPAGQVTVARTGKSHKEIYVTPSGLQNGLEEVLIIVEGVHTEIPNTPPGNQTVHLLPPPPGGDGAAAAPLVQTGPLSTDADRLLDHYRKIGEAEQHVYGDRGKGAPNYNIDPAAMAAQLAVAAQKAADAKAGVAKAGGAKTDGAKAGSATAGQAKAEVKPTPATPAVSAGPVTPPVKAPAKPVSTVHPVSANPNPVSTVGPLSTNPNPVYSSTPKRTANPAGQP